MVTMTKIEAVLTRADQTCQQQGARLTSKRRTMLAILLEAGVPCSAYEIVEHYREKTGETIPAMSVYRMLDFLMAQGLVHKLASTNKFIACEHITCSHSHKAPQFLICDGCHSVQEIGVDKTLFNALQHSIDQQHFQLNSPQLELHGLCEVCQRP
ncbi:Zinc uptake regulation protein ZUR [Methylophaga frappieri]|uniref:Zinc uptake regulation protein ZUR n=1 Tax=Methylophaga frappieri (strain ATCC BAA-2434 / DSM 25690 / JAM7) TaxID=754477 RepID=I1YL24_METFJ|nr:Fur family transcriptional regulator [Methylophaga frappieri]AFJ03617.1 Zinc uptake regulation protein ZUR [Methylophaga frappieri]